MHDRHVKAESNILSVYLFDEHKYLSEFTLYTFNFHILQESILVHIMLTLLNCSEVVVKNSELLPLQLFLQLLELLRLVTCSWATSVIEEWNIKFLNQCSDLCISIVIYKLDVDF